MVRYFYTFDTFLNIMYGICVSRNSCRSKIISEIDYIALSIVGDITFVTPGQLGGKEARDSLSEALSYSCPPVVENQVWPGLKF